MSDSNEQTCPSCGAELPEDRAGALCPACLMSRALRAEDETLLAPLPDVPPDQARTAAMPATPPSPSASAFELPHEMGDYSLISRLGQGGMGTVYEAVQRSTGRRLAVKLLDQRLDSPEMRQRFLREGRLAARVSHPSSLYVFGSEEIDGIPVITMEIAPGGTLQDALDRRGPLPVNEAVDAVLGMIDGLEAAFERGVLHRDIKPSNCFVCPDGTVKVGDFGLSVSTLPSADTFMTQTGRVMGTPAFASPEQLRGDEVGVRSDIYSVGATLFALLTGRAAFEGHNAVQVVASVIETPPPAATRFRDDVPAETTSPRFGPFRAFRGATGTLAGGRGPGAASGSVADPEERRRDLGGTPIRRSPRSAPGLQRVEAEGATWDAYEAIRGTPIAARVGGGPVPWSVMRYWLYDLASELWATTRGDGLPMEYRVDQVWISDDGRAVLLDAPWPSDEPGSRKPGGSAHNADGVASIAVDTPAGQQRLLREVAEHVDPLTVPVHAQPVLRNLRSGSFEKLTYLTGTLRGLLNKPAEVSRALRAASLLVIPGYAWIATFLGITANTDPSVGVLVWLGRAAVASLVMMHFIAFFDIVLAFWRKSTGLTTFGLEAVTRSGRASPARMLARAGIMWGPVVVPTAAFGIAALADGRWIGFREAAVLGGFTCVGALVLCVSALLRPVRGLHDRVAGVWIGRR